MNTARACISVAIFTLTCTAALPKVSTEVVLCFAPADRTISPEVKRQLASFVSQSNGFGRVSALLVTTTSASLEPEQVSAQRISELGSYLSAQGFNATPSDSRLVLAPASSVGCSVTQVAVEFEALFPHDGYR